MANLCDRLAVGQCRGFIGGNVVHGDLCVHMQNYSGWLVPFLNVAGDVMKA